MAIGASVDELRRVTGGGPPEAGHLAALEYLEGAIRESLRLRPVVPFVVRKTVRPFAVGSREYPAGVVLCPCSYLVHRREEFRASKIMLARAQANPKIVFLMNTVVEDVHDASAGTVTGVTLKNLKTGESWRRDVDGFFVAIGHIPNTKVFRGQLDLDPDGYIISHGGARTNVPGVFHAGDVQDRVYRQAITASGAGCMAAIEAERFLEAEGH